MNPIFLATISDQHKLLFDKPEQFKQYLHTFPSGKRVELTVEKLKHPRSNNQNAYYWGCVVKLIAQHTGHDPEMVHELLKQLHAPKWHFTNVRLHLAAPGLPEAVIPTSTTRLDTIAFTEYTEKCRVWACEFLGLQIPLPGEVTV